MNTAQPNEHHSRRIPAKPERPHGSGAAGDDDRGKSAGGRSRGKESGGRGWYFVIALGLAIMLALLLLGGLWSKRGHRNERDQTNKAQGAGAHTVQVVKVTQSPASFDVSLPGSAQALTTATLYARVNGYLKARLVDIGDRVHEGQLMALIDAPEIDAQMNQSRAQLEQNRAARGIADVTYQREKKLLEQKVVSQQEHDQALAMFNQAEANVKAAEANVQNLSAQQGFEKITAPFDGVVTSRFLDEGALITSGSGTTAPSIFTVSQSDTLRVFINVPQVYVANVIPGQPVEVSATEYPQEIFHGYVARTADSLDPAARTERVEIQLPSENGKLLPGMYLSIRFKVQQAVPALIVPANTVDIRREGPRVAVVGQDKKIAYRGVKLGRDFGKTIEILAGVKTDETLVVNPTTDLVEGEQVEIAKPEADKPAAPTKG